MENPKLSSVWKHPATLPALLLVAAALFLTAGVLFNRQDEAQAAPEVPTPAAPAVENPPAAAPRIEPTQPQPTQPAQATDAPQIETHAGIEVQASNFRSDGTRLSADICFTLPDDGDWSIWKPYLSIAGTEISDNRTSPIELVKPGADGQADRRCDTISFKLPPNVDQATYELVIPYMAAYPREGEYCTTYLHKVQANLDAHAPGVLVKCVEEGGVVSMQVVSRPASISPAEVEQLLNSDDNFAVEGPWTFSGKLD